MSTGSERLELHERLTDGRRILDLSGTIDVSTAPRLKAALTSMIEAGETHPILNLEHVRSVDSAGLGVLLGALKRLRELDGGIAMVTTNALVVKIFTITRLNSVLPIYDTEEAALNAENAD